MKIKSDFVCHSMGDEHVVVAVGARTQEFRGMIRLNGTGAFLWPYMQQDFTLDQLTQALVSEYDVAEAEARKTAAAFLKTLMDAGVLET